MIKSQCNNCSNQGTCGKSILYNGYSCKDYVKKINLKKDDSNTITEVSIANASSSSTIKPTNLSSTVDTSSYNLEVDERSFWQKLFSFKGRNDRREYWLTILLLYLLLLPVYLIQNANENIGFVFSIIWLILCLVIQLANTTKRLHDLGCNAWSMLLLMIPIINIIIGIWIAFWPGDKDNNKFGLVP